MALATLLAGCPDEKPTDLSAHKTSTRAMPEQRVAAPMPRLTMPDGALPFALPSVGDGSSLAFADELVLFDRTILRKKTSPTDTYAGETTPYVRPVSLAPVGVTARLDDGAGQIALFVNATSSAVDTLYLLDDLKLSSVAFAAHVGDARVQLPYLFGARDPTVRDRLQIDVSEDELEIGDETISGASVIAPIDTLVNARRGQSSLGIEARLGIRSGTTNQRMAAVLFALGRAKVETITLVPVQDSVAHSSTAYADHGTGTPSIRIGQPLAHGELDKAIIRRYIKRNVQKILYCYEKELLVSPTLAGTISVQFFIAPSGEAKTVTASGVDPRVAACISDVVKSIEFPKPKGGGGVQVNYPFTFRPTGG